MTEDTAPGADAPGQADPDAEGHPKGTLLLAGLFLVLMLATWWFAYLTMIARS